MNRIIGAIYPIPQEFSSRLFDGNFKVFVKYLAHSTTRLKPRNKVVFYASHGPKALIGEGTIEKIEFLSPEIVIAKHRAGLFLNETEFYRYVKKMPSRAPTKAMMVLVLKKLKRYPRPIDYNRPMTMAGQYLSDEEYFALQKQLQKTKHRVRGSEY
jgi:hypothetical protein